MIIYVKHTPNRVKCKILVFFLLGVGFRLILVILGVDYEGKWYPVFRSYSDLHPRIVAGFSKALKARLLPFFGVFRR